jgi:hypothetical protein
MAANQQTAVQNLTLEVANAYKTASDRAEVVIQLLNSERLTLQHQLEQSKKAEASLQKELLKLQQQLDRMSHSSDPADNVST